MAQFSDQTDLRTDAYPMNQSSSAAAPPTDVPVNQKKGLGISAAALLLGGAAWSMWPPKVTKTVESGTVESQPSAPANVPEDIEVAKSVNDAMSFDQAHAAAREEIGMGGVFTWSGHLYNTFSTDEWSSLSIEQRIEYTQTIIGEELPVQPAQNQPNSAPQISTVTEKPTVIEGHLDGRRVIGIDTDNDGVIDQLVGDSGDGYNLVVLDATGDEGLDTLYKYDSLDGEWVMVQKIDHPVVLSNDDFSQGLEESMSREVVDWILEPGAPATEAAAVEAIAEEPATDDEPAMPEDDEPIYLADNHESNDNTYVNNGDVRDMDA